MGLARFDPVNDVMTIEKSIICKVCRLILRLSKQELSPAAEKVLGFGDGT